MELTASERAWLEHDEALWKRAQAIVAHRPELDVSGVRHALRNLERTPEERLSRGLRHGKLRPRDQ